MDDTGVPADYDDLDRADDQIFIKVPGYKHILQDLTGIKQVLDNMREALDVVREVEAVKKKSVDVFLQNMDRLNQQLNDIKVQFPEVHDIDIHIDEGDELKQVDTNTPRGGRIIDESVTDLQDELQQLRNQLDEFG